MIKLTERRNLNYYYAPGILPESNGPDMIIWDICEYFKICRSDLTSSNQKREFVEARQFCIYFMNKYFSNLSLKQIGKYFSGKGGDGFDHSTVIHAIRKVRDVSIVDKTFRKIHDDLDLLIGEKIINAKRDKVLVGLTQKHER